MPRVVIPVAAAAQVAASYRATLWLSSAIGAASAVIGLLVSFYADAPTGAAIVLVTLGVYCATALVRAAVRNVSPRRTRAFAQR